MQKIKTFIKNRTKWQITLLIVVVVIGVALFSGGNGKRVEVLVERGSIVEEVVATGKVRSTEEVDLGFERAGRVVRVGAKAGEKVQAGSALVVLDQSEILANLRKAKAQLNESLVNLSKVKRTTAEDSSNAYDKLYVALIDAYTEARDSVLNTSDRFFTKTSGGTPLFEVIYASGGQYIEFLVDDTLARRVSTQRMDVVDLLDTWTLEIDKIRNTKGDLANTIALTEKNVDVIKIFLGDVALALSSIDSNSQTEEGIVDGYKTSVASARTALNLALDDLLVAKANYLDSPRELSLGVLTNFDSILEEEAKVEVARAEVESLESELSNTVITAPISGIVTKQEAKVGQIVTVGEVIVSVISDKQLEVEADISEVNIGKIRVGNKTRVTLDAFPGDELLGEVSYIEPGDKLVDGVVNYEVRVVFTSQLPEGIKTGLTASLDIETGRKDDVLRIPAYSIERRDGKKFVMVKSAEKEEEREIFTGMSGKDGFIEVLQGLSEGEVVLGETL